LRKGLAARMFQTSNGGMTCEMTATSMNGGLQTRVVERDFNSSKKKRKKVRGR